MFKIHTEEARSGLGEKFFLCWMLASIRSFSYLSRAHMGTAGVTGQIPLPLHTPSPKPGSVVALLCVPLILQESLGSGAT